MITESLIYAIAGTVLGFLLMYGMLFIVQPVLQMQLGKVPVESLDQSRVKIPGYLVPLNIGKDQTATELLLVPTLGACVHVPPPPNQTIFIRYDKGIKVTEAGYTPYWLEGVIKVESNTSEYTDMVYAMTVDSIKEFE